MGPRTTEGFPLGLWKQNYDQKYCLYLEIEGGVRRCVWVASRQGGRLVTVNFLCQLYWVIGGGGDTGADIWPDITLDVSG